MDERGIDYDHVQEIVSWCSDNKSNPVVMMYARTLLKQINYTDDALAHLRTIINRFELIKQQVTVPVTSKEKD